jgi:hypothetical protein
LLRHVIHLVIPVRAIAAHGSGGGGGSGSQGFITGLVLPTEDSDEVLNADKDLRDSFPGLGPFFLEPDVVPLRHPTPLDNEVVYRMALLDGKPPVRLPYSFPEVLIVRSWSTGLFGVMPCFKICMCLIHKLCDVEMPPTPMTM